MSNESDLQMQKHFESICKDRGWTTESNQIVWPASPIKRADLARELFGLELMMASDRNFLDVKKELDAEDLSAMNSLRAATAILSSLNDSQKSAILTVVDDVLSFALYQFTIQLDRFDHGILSLRFRNLDKDHESLPDSEIVINPHGGSEMFEDAARWRIDYSAGVSIGRPADPLEDLRSTDG